MRVRVRHAFLASLLLVAPLAGQDTARVDGTEAPVPFGVGEMLAYDVRFGRIHVGNGSMEVAGVENVRGRAAWHTVFRVRGGIPFYRVNDRYESWLDTHTISSLRYVQQIDEGNYERERRFEIFPERRIYIEGQDDPQPSVAHPLDDGSFIYFLRTIPLRVGLDTSLNDYFRADRNPVRIRVVRRERITVPAGTFDAVVVQPIISTKGIFSEGGRAEVWLSDDSRRIMLQMKSKLSFGSLNLYLTSYRPGPIAPGAKLPDSTRPAP